MSQFNGFLAGSSVSKDAGDNGARFAVGIAALESGRLAQCYECFYGMKNTEAHFNLALCHMKEGDASKALTELNQAISGMNRRMPETLSSASRTDIPEKLEKYEADSDGYLAPMLSDEPELFSYASRQRMLRLKADLLFALDRTEELNAVVASLSGKHYGNIDEIINKQKEKSV